MTTQRCFIALPLSDSISSALRAASAAVRAADASWAKEKWVPPENLHLTVKFLGDVDASRIDEVAACVREVALKADPFELELRCVRPSPGGRRTRMIWAVFADPGGKCAAVAARLDTGLQRLGFDAEQRPFQAHVTLCRARRPHPLDPSALAAATDALAGVRRSMSVPAVSLLSSRLTPHGAEYTCIVECHLGGA